MRRYSNLPSFSAKHGSPNFRVKLNKKAFKELLFWANLPLADCCSKLSRPNNVCYLFTDAS